MSSRSTNPEPDQPYSAIENRRGETEGTVPPQEGGTKPPAPTPTVIQSDREPSGATAEPTSIFPPPANFNDFTAGSLLGPYELLEKLGQGGMGAVYKARHQHLDMLVAIKVLPQQFTQQADSVARFKREMKAVGRIRHPNIVQAMDAGEIGGTQYLAMEYIEGHDLAKLVATKGVFSVANACKAIKQAAQALSAAHAAGLVHRDIKPSNLLLAKSGQIKILDLGLALLGEEGGQTSDVTAHGQTFGTPDYMAPEQWADSHAVDARTDLYALGCTLYFLLAGRAPYSDEKHRTPFNKMNGHVNEPIPDLKSARADAPDNIVAIYRKLMAKSSLERYQSATELVEDLNRHAAGKVVSESSVSLMIAPSVADSATLAGGDSHGTDVAASDVPTLLSQGAIISTAAPREVLSDATSKPRRVPRWLLFAGPVLAVCLLGGLYVALSNRGAPKSPDESLVSNPKVAANSQPATPDPQPAGWHGWPANAPKPAIAPFDADQAKKHQEEWAAYLKVPVERENSIGMKFRLIPPGEFLMGSTPEEIEAAKSELTADPELTKIFHTAFDTEAPQHRVILTRPFYLSLTETRQRDYLEVMGENPSAHTPTGTRSRFVEGLDTSMHPVENVAWNQAAQFCERLSSMEGLVTCYTVSDENVVRVEGLGYRLPTEAEWEYSTRAGSTTRYWFGNVSDRIDEVAWCRRTSGHRTHPVQQLLANPFGLFDNYGNVSEWCDDIYEHDSYSHFKAYPAINPVVTGALQNNKVRGGAIHSYSPVVRSAFRDSYPWSGRADGVIGFRTVLSVDAVRQSLKVTGPSIPNPEKTTSAAPAGWHNWPADAPKPAIAPFDAEQAKKHQEEWAAYLKVPVEWENSLGMKFRLIPPGEFLMGVTKEDAEAIIAQHPDEDTYQLKEKWLSSAPRHKVALTQAFYLAITEVTQEQYEKAVGENPSSFSANGEFKDRVAGNDTSQHPVTMVSLVEGARFCIALSQQERLQQAYSSKSDTVARSNGNGYCLPSEAEWEYACRAGTDTHWFSGDDESKLATAAWYGERYTTSPVGLLRSNPFGLYDMHGNAWEACHELDPIVYRRRGDGLTVDPPKSALMEMQALRGGNHWFDASYCRSGFHNYTPSQPYPSGGLRVSLSVEAVRQSLNARANSAWHNWPADAPTPAIAPFDAEQAKQHQAAWAAYLKVPVEWENSLGMKFRLIPPGEFLMGSTAEEQETYRDAEPSNRYWPSAINSEGPQHRTVLTKPFYLSVYETRQRDYEQIVGSQPSHFASTGANRAVVELLDTANFPVENLSWNEAVEYCGNLGAREGLPEFYSRSEQRWLVAGGEGYRLPTEAEWECACRAGTTTTFWSGPRELDAKGVAWTKENSNGRPHAVGELAPNPFGLYDVHGNVPEWCHDGYTNASYERYALQSAVDPVVKPEEQSSPLRKYRGGDFSHPLSWARSAMRSHLNDDTAGPGFRLALSIGGVRRALKVDGPALPAAIQTPSP